MSIFSKKNSYLGVDIGANGIKLVELKKNKGRPQLWTYGILEEALDIHLPALKTDHNSTQPDSINPQNQAQIDKYGQLLSSLIKAAKVETKHVTASIPVSHVFRILPSVAVEQELERVLQPVQAVAKASGLCRSLRRNS